MASIQDAIAAFVSSNGRQVHKTVRRIFTIGYEQSRLPSVLDALKKAKVDMLIDTRPVAASSATRLIVTAAASPRSWRSEPAPASTT